MFIILTLIVIVAAFNIISGQIMMVKEKGRNIAIMRTMGATRGAILRVFLLSGASIGIVGTFVGCALGTAFVVNIETIRRWLEGLTGVPLFNETVYFLSKLPAIVDPARGDADRRHGAGADPAGVALSCLAGGTARSGRGAAL